MGAPIPDEAAADRSGRPDLAEPARVETTDGRRTLSPDAQATRVAGFGDQFEACPAAADSATTVIGAAIGEGESTRPDSATTFLVARGRGQDGPAREREGASGGGPSFAPGAILQRRYELGKELGRGGMGVVYLGRDVRLGRSVAIKVIRSQAAGLGDERRRDEFAEEARLGANLAHPGIATVYDFGFHEGNPFAVFEFIPGLTLRQVIEHRGRMPLEEVRLIIGALAQALDFAHERHVVHRDLKPENIRATEQGAFKVLDLGLAKDFHSHDDWTFCGTPAYASPEQAGGQPCDGRADQYALAVIAFEMLAGRRPFDSPHWFTLLDMHAKEPPPRARSLRADVPAPVDEAIDKALGKDPNGRFATCVEFAAAMGCQLLSAPAPAAEILLEATCGAMAGRWKSFTHPLSFGLSRPRTHLALAPDALWATYRGMVMRWPLATIALVGRRGRWLRLRLEAAEGGSEQRFRLSDGGACESWIEKIEGLIAEGPGGAAGPLGTPRPDPVVLLESRPSTRFQILGPVDVKTARRKATRPSLAIRGLMLGADAVVGIRVERLAGAYRTEFRATGTAVRAVDREGRLELKARWFDAQTRWVGAGLIGVASFDLFGALLVLAMAAGLLPFAPPAGSFTPMPLVEGLGAAWVFGLAVAFGRLGWPQLARPVATCFFAMAGSWVASVAVLAALAVASRSLAGGSLMLAITLIGAVASFSIFSFLAYLASRAWAIDRDYRRLVEGDAHRVAASHRVLGRLALGISIAYAAYEVGGAAWRAPGLYRETIRQFAAAFEKVRSHP